MTEKDILVEQGAWIDYLYDHLAEFGKIVDNARAVKEAESKKPKK